MPYNPRMTEQEINSIVASALALEVSPADRGPKHCRFHRFTVIADNKHTRFKTVPSLRRELSIISSCFFPKVFLNSGKGVTIWFE